MDTLAEAEDYFEDLARLHIDLLHELNGRRAFAKLRTEDHILQIKNSITPNIVVVASITGQGIGAEDNNEIRRGVELMFASRASIDGNQALAITAAMNKAEQIMFDWIGKMKYDNENECELNFDLDRIRWEEIDGPWLENFYGWVLYIPFRGYMPAYDEDSWTGVPATPLPDVIIFVDRFRVGAVGAPMVEGDTTYSNGLLGDSSFLILADGKAIHQVTDIPGERYSSKPFAGIVITINGWVTDGEVIEIYKIA